MNWFYQVVFLFEFGIFMVLVGSCWKLWMDEQ